MRIRRPGVEPVIIEFPSGADPFEIIEHAIGKLAPLDISASDTIGQAERDKRFEAVMAARRGEEKPWLRKDPQRPIKPSKRRKAA